MEHDDFEEPDVDSDFDYEESKKKKKKALAKSTPKVWKCISLVVSILRLLCCMMFVSFKNNSQTNKPNIIIIIMTDAEYSRPKEADPDELRRYRHREAVFLWKWAAFSVLSY